MENKETAVEWLIDTLTKKTIFSVDAVFKTALKMEKEQTIKFADTYADAIIKSGCRQLAEEFYDELKTK